ncbi:MAG: helix-turn-helix domain-containing protein [Parasphingorhabdus sp.]|uniref:helix-turn-helix domain-containing protein n=1 Tax=Parasphingorhabdus sp. TaxID=2709688 RepID=UPI003299DB14
MNMRSTEPLVVSVKEARNLLGGLSHMTIYRMFDRGDLDSVRIGGRRMVKMSSIKLLAGEAA